MSHQLNLSIPDELYERLMRLARAKDQTVEALAGEYLARAVTPDVLPGEGLRDLVGFWASGVTDAGDRHDHYIGQALHDEMTGRPDA